MKCFGGGKRISINSTDEYSKLKHTRSLIFFLRILAWYYRLQEKWFQQDY
jgi:hypothetical protein